MASFLALTGKAPWEVGEGDVKAYIESLEAKRLRPGSINERLTALESFYAYCRESGDAICGAGFNPLSRVKRPKRVKYENARYLSEKEEAALHALSPGLMSALALNTLNNQSSNHISNCSTGSGGSAGHCTLLWSEADKLATRRAARRPAGPCWPRPELSLRSF